MFVPNEVVEKHSKKVVTVAPSTKLIAWVSVITLNMALLFYIFLFALGQTQARQGAWLKSFIYWFVSEVFITSTVLLYHSLRRT